MLNVVILFPALAPFETLNISFGRTLTGHIHPGVLRPEGGLHFSALWAPLLLPAVRGAVRRVSCVPRSCGAED